MNYFKPQTATEKAEQILGVNIPAVLKRAGISLVWTHENEVKEFILMGSAPDEILLLLEEMRANHETETTTKKAGAKKTRAIGAKLDKSI